MSDVIFNIEVVKTAGAPRNDFWSGNFEEKPQDQEKLEHRGHLFLVVSLKSAQDTAALAHNFWTEFVTNFYQNLSGGVLLALSESVKKACDKVLPQISAEDLGFVAASVWGKILYLVCAGGAAAGIVRNSKFSKILQAENAADEISSASGFLENSDLVFLGTLSFFEEFENLESFSKSPVLQIEEELASKIAQSAKSEKIAATVIKVREAAQIQEAEVVSFVLPEEAKNQLKAQATISKVFGLFEKRISQFWVIFINNLSNSFYKIVKLFPRRDIYLQAGFGKPFKKRLFSLILGILVLVLAVSLSFGIWQRRQKLAYEKFSEFFGKASSFYEQSVEISSINRLKARELLGQAEKNLTQAKKFKFEKKKVTELATKIEVANRASLKLVKIDNPNLIFDLTLVKAQAGISEIEKIENILAFDKTSPTLFTVDLVTKTGQIKAGGEEFRGFSNFTILANYAYFLKPADGIYQLNLDSAELKKVINASPLWGEILDLTNFAGNLYLLDGAAGQIWKYTTGAAGFSEISQFLKQGGLNFSSASFTIDGFVWVLSGDGKLYQATPGDAKLVEISGLDKPLSAKTILRTTDEAENLYIADLGNLRIVVISKTGLYLAQYTSGVFGQISDFSVDEKAGKLYFATGSKVFSIDLAK